MGKYAKYQRPPFKRNSEQHPVWRGIGCLMIVILPVVSYAGAVLIVRYGVAHGWPFPPELTGHIQFPDWVWESPVLLTLARPIANYPHLGAVLIIFLILLVLISGIFTTLYAIMRHITGPSRYTAVDAPPSKHKVKVYKR